MLTVQGERRMRAESATWRDELARAVRNGSTRPVTIEGLQVDDYLKRN